MNHLLCLLVFLGLTSCYRPAQYLTDVGETLTADTAVVYVINPSATTGGPENNLIYIDDFLVGRIGRNAHLKVRVVPGSDGEVSIRTSARPNGIYAFPVAPNSTHYFEYETSERENAQDLPLLRKLSEEDGKLILSQVPAAVPYRPR